MSATEKRAKSGLVEKGERSHGRGGSVSGVVIKQYAWKGERAQWEHPSEERGGKESKK